MDFKISDQEKKILIGGTVILGGFIIYKLFFANKIDNSGTIIDPTGNGNNASTGGVVPYSFNAQAVANALYEEMAATFTNKDEIINILTPISKNQFSEVIKKFGNKSYNTLTNNNYAVIGFTLPKYPLQRWLKEELDAQRYNTLKIKYSGILV
jgi:hypothetical protein